MKTKILLSALATFFFMNVTAFYNSASLEISLKQKRNTMYIIELENGSVYETYDNIHIDNLNYGINRIKIFKQKFNRQRNHRGNGREKLVFDGMINLPRNTTVFSQLIHRTLVINQIIPKRMRRRHPAPSENCRLEMNRRMFNDLKRSIRDEAFDSNKLDLLTFASRKNNLNARQVLELMKLLSFDSYKLKFAKRAYDNTLDKENYFIVANGLVFSSHKRELMKYIRRR